ncbi:hypothetical protein SDC9_154774 [bioreactor metagenome]|uniref:B3/B4 tRNA-binding domain-containing protein n=1 Tax=bioreactor metagenome TaxID=1076179 RepID=A0A645F4G6_9ZZZZ
MLPQLESVVKGKKIPEGLPLVEAMFIAELQNMLLTAGHDLDQISLPLRFSVSTGQESYLTLSGREVTAVAGDLMFSDRQSVISSILRGPDRRTAITEGTSRVLYSAYAPPGVEQELTMKHLNDMEGYVRLFSKEAVTTVKKIYG